jgi:histidine kinase
LSNTIINNDRYEFDSEIDDYGKLFELVPCIITVQDKDFRIVKYNREFSDKFGSKKGDYCFAAYKGRNEQCEDCPLEKTFKDGKVHFDEQSGLNKDGTTIHWIVKTSPVRNPNGEIIAAMEMSINITEQKLLQEELRKSENKYYAIFNNIPNPVFVLDKDTLKILDCNESMESVYGFNKREIVKRCFLDLFMDDDKDKFIEMIKTSKLINMVKHKTSDDLIIFVNIRISPSEYLDQKVLLVTISDITQRLETEQQLLQASKLATLGEMASGIAHELNQPLSVIKTSSSFIINKIKKNEFIDENILLTMFDKIDGNVDRASNIINHMRQFSRMSDKGVEKIQVNEVLEKAFEIFKQQLKIRGIEVTMEIDVNIPHTIGDPNRLEQVFINLLLNARSAVEEKWENKDCSPGDKKIFLRSKCEGEWIVIEIGDNGIGIPKNISDKIFEPFFTTKEVGKGTGLGLSISYGIIKDLGGDIKIDANVKEGALFIIRIPIKD